MACHGSFPGGSSGAAAKRRPRIWPRFNFELDDSPLAQIAAIPVNAGVMQRYGLLCKVQCIPSRMQSC